MSSKNNKIINNIIGSLVSEKKSIDEIIQQILNMGFRIKETEIIKRASIFNANLLKNTKKQYNKYGVFEEVLSEIFAENKGVIHNLETRHRDGIIKENGGDGNCLLYSLLDANLDSILKLIPDLETKKSHLKRGMELRKFIAKTIRRAELGLKEPRTQKESSEFDRLESFEPFAQMIKDHVKNKKEIVDMDIGETHYNGTTYKEFKNKLYYVGQDALNVYARLVQRHIIVFQLSHNMDEFNGEMNTNTQSESIINIIRYDDKTPFINYSPDTCNYIFVVRSPGSVSHYRSIRKKNQSKDIKLDDDVVERLNEKLKPEVTERILHLRGKSIRRLTRGEKIELDESESFISSISYTDFVDALQPSNKQRSRKTRSRKESRPRRNSSTKTSPKKNVTRKQKDKQKASNSNNNSIENHRRELEKSFSTINFDDL
mgnify:CR=1 FL=1